MRFKHRIKHTPFSEGRFYLSCAFSLMTFVLLFVCFVTPYWLQSWPRLHTSFNRLGLWEFCLKGYVQRLDPSEVSYFDCWWILSPYYGKIFNYLVPFWFTIIQVMVSLAVIMQLILLIWLIAYLCERVRHIERRLFTMRFFTVGHSLTAVFMFIGIIVFGANYQNPNWMPQPKFNWPSWSYGFAILGAFSAIYAALCFGMMEREMRRDIQDLVHNFPMSTKLKHRRHWKLRRHRWEKEEEKAKKEKEPLESGRGLGSAMQLSTLPGNTVQEGLASNLGEASHISSIHPSLPGYDDDDGVDDVDGDEYEEEAGMPHRSYRPMSGEV